MEIKCSKCRFKFDVPDCDSGKGMCSCPRCGNKFEVASPAAPQPRPPVQPLPAAKPAQQPVLQPAAQQPVQQPLAPKQPQVIYVKSQTSHNLIWLFVGAVVLVAVAIGGTLMFINQKNHPVIPDAQTQETVAYHNDTIAASYNSIAASNEPQNNPPEQKVYMSLWGSIGQDNTSELEMDGETGWYVPYEGAPRRTLQLESYDPQTNQCVLSAFLNGEKFGQFEGIFQSFSATDDTGEEHYGQNYEGTFTNLRNGIKLKFYLYAD